MADADTLAGLAEQVGINPDALQATVDRFNRFAVDGVDTDFGRGETGWDKAWGDPEADSQLVPGRPLGAAVLRYRGDGGGARHQGGTARQRIR